MPARRDPKEAFDEKYIPEPNSGCWLWTATFMKNGYGRFGMRNPRRNELAHRAAWQLYVGAIPEGMRVLHHCDNPACVNPEHLFVGTHLDNMADMTKKARSTHGVRHPQAKLTEEQVLKIRGDSRILIEIAADYGVSNKAISKIKRRDRWTRI